MSNCLYEEFGSRVRAAREAKNMTQGELARRIGLSRASMTNIEAGRQRVLLHQAIEIARGLDAAPVDLLLAGAATLPAPIGAPTLTAAAIAALTDEMGASFKLVRPDYSRVRERVGEILKNVEGPAVNVELLAASMKAEIRHGDLEDEVAGLLWQGGGRRVVVVNKLDSDTRKRFTIAHELGHLTLHRREDVHVDRATVFSVDRRDIRSGVEVEEVEANAFAANLLMPAAWLLADLDKPEFDLSRDDTLRKLAERYQVGVQSMAFRIATLTRHRA